MDAKFRAMRVIYREVVRLARLHDRQPHLKAMVSRKLSKQYSQTAQMWVEDPAFDDLHLPQMPGWSNTNALTRQFLDELLQGGEYYPPAGVSMTVRFQPTRCTECTVRRGGAVLPAATCSP